jgi:hypothetical protein
MIESKRCDDQDDPQRQDPQDEFLKKQREVETASTGQCRNLQSVVHLLA